MTAAAPPEADARDDATYERQREAVLENLHGKLAALRAAPADDPCGRRRGALLELIARLTPGR